MLLASLLALAACGGGDDESNQATPTSTGETTSTSAIKVGLVTDLGQLNDRGFNQLAYQGLQRAERELGIQGRVLQSASAADYIPNMTRLAREKYDLIIGVGFAQGDAIDTSATKFPDRKFAIIDVDQASLKHKPKNVVGLIFKEQEVGYLAGYLAGLSEKRRPGPDVIGSVGGFKEPPVDRFIAGYQAGAKKADPGIKVLNGYSSDWDDQAKCKELALNQIGQGAGVVFQVAGGARSTQPARKRSGASGSTPTSRSSARTCSRVRRRRWTRRSSPRSSRSRTARGRVAGTRSSASSRRASASARSARRSQRATSRP